MKTISKKVCLLGDFAVGKTSLVKRFVYNMFEDKYLSTIGVHVSRKAISLPQPTGMVDLAMMLWDIAGNNGFEHVRSSYVRGAAGAVLVCDLTRPQTFDNLIDYVDLLSSVSPDARLVVAANKHDLATQVVSRAEAEATARKFRAPLFFTSAKTGSEVETLFRQLGQLLVS